MHERSLVINDDIMVSFYFNIIQELKDLEWVFSEYDFFIKNKYKVIYPNFSKNLTQELIKNPKHKSKQLEKEFTNIFKKDKDLYIRTMHVVSENWKKIEAEFFSSLDKLLPDNKIKDIRCFISRYGPGGTYYLPDKICIRTVIEDNADIKNANLTIAHEIIHLYIDEQIQANKISFEDTEMMVDLVLVKTPIGKLLGNAKIQGFGDERIEKIFINNHYNIPKAIDDIARFKPYSC